MTSRDLNELHPRCALLVEKWLNRAARAGWDVLVTCTLRDEADQALLFRRNRSFVAIEAAYYRLKRLGLERQAEILMSTPAQPGSRGVKKTGAPPGLSFHQKHGYKGQLGSFAVDFVPMAGGKPLWEDAHAFRALGELAESYHLTWAGRWVKFKERCHVQWDDLGGIKIERLAKGGYA